MKNVFRHVRFYDSPVGKIAMLSDGNSLTGLYIKNQSGYDAVENEQNAISPLLPIFTNTKQWLDEYFSGNEPDFMPQIAFYGTEFQHSVWERLRKIPYGETVTYGELAAEIAEKRGIKRMSAQAVGGAVGKNPISIIIPCHRVIGANGTLTGYNGGIEIKEKLLEIEHKHR